jgi:hypothetical protein
MALLEVFRDLIETWVTYRKVRATSTKGIHGIEPINDEHMRCTCTVFKQSHERQISQFSSYVFYIAPNLHQLNHSPYLYV